MTKYSIRENSWIAKIAARKLKASSVAIVVGNTIHLHGSTKENFLADEQWVKHELCHIEQFERYGFLNFIVRYLWESYKKGYYNNRFEKEAREAEN